MTSVATSYFNQLTLLTQAYESLNCHSYLVVYTTIISVYVCAKGKFHNCQST